MTGCPDADRVVAYHDGEGEFDAEFERHVESCRSCGLVLRMLGEARPAFAGEPLEEHVVEGLLQAVFSGEDASAPAPQAPRIKFWDVGIPGVLGAAMGLAAGLATGVLGPGTTWGHMAALALVYGAGGVWLDHRLALRDFVRAQEGRAGEALAGA